MPALSSDPLKLACEDLFAGRHQRAYAAAQAALRQGGQADVRAVLIMATIALDHGNLAGARDLVGIAGNLPGARCWLHVLAGRLALAGSDTAHARAEAVAALEHEPDHPVIAGDLGVLLSRTGLHAAAIPCFEAAGSDDPQAAYNLAIAYQFTGNLDAARDGFARLLERHPGHARARLALVQLDRQDEGALGDIAEHFAATTDTAARLALGHAAAKVCEDNGLWDEAFDWLEKAKATKRREVAHDRAATDALFAAARNSIAPLAPDNRVDPAPVFIVGLPRTGTTLVERILSAHPQLASAGELSDFAVLLKRRTGTGGPLVLDPETIAAGAVADLTGIEADYVDRLRSIIGDAPRGIDKMPFNLFFVPLILKALPDAKVICLRRNPFDAAMSNFRQLFATGFTYYSYAYDLGDTAHFVARFEQLADAYARLLPATRFRSQHYEDIVADTEGQARALTDFLGLDWDPACLAFHENGAPVATASSVQVRKPVYTTSLERWRRYGPASERLMAEMARYSIRP